MWLPLKKNVAGELVVVVVIVAVISRAEVQKRCGNRIRETIGNYKVK